MDIVRLAAVQCPNLEVLLLAALKGINDEVAICIAHNLPKLKQLSLMNASCTDEGISQISLHCSQLRTLVLSGNHNITDKSVLCLARMCPHLSELYLSGCALVTRAAIQFVAVSCCFTVSPPNTRTAAVCTPGISLYYSRCGTYTVCIHILVNTSICTLPYLHNTVYTECTTTSFNVYVHRAGKMSMKMNTLDLFSRTSLQDTCVSPFHFEHNIPNAPQGLLMARNLDSGEFVRVDKWFDSQELNRCSTAAF